jgi:Tol biopolymer transport system component
MYAEVTKRRSLLRRGCLAAVIVVGLLVSTVVVIIAVGIVKAVTEHRKPVPLPPATLPQASAPLGTDRLLFDSNRTGNFELYGMRTTGTGVEQLTSDTRYDSWWPRLSPDRRRVLFYRTPAGSSDKHYDRTSLWMMNAAGGDVTELLPSGAYGWIVQGHAEWSPDGRRLVMFGGKRVSPQIFVTSVLGRQPVQITHRGGTNIDPSWSPDGTTVAFVGCPGSFCLASRTEIYEVGSNGGDPVRVTHDSIRDNDPYYSPSGDRIAWLSETSAAGIAGTWNIRMAAPDGSDLTMVTNDHNINSRPQWSPDGKEIYFHRLVYDAAQPHFGIWAVHPDGTGLRDLSAGQPGAATYPSP